MPDTSEVPRDTDPSTGQGDTTGAAGVRDALTPATPAPRRIKVNSSCTCS